VYRRGLVHLGVILIRLGGLLPETKARIVAKVLAERATEMPNAFSVISPGMVRIRPSRECSFYKVSAMIFDQRTIFELTFRQLVNRYVWRFLIAFGIAILPLLLVTRSSLLLISASILAIIFGIKILSTIFRVELRERD